MLQVFCNHPSHILPCTFNSLLLQTQLQHLLTPCSGITLSLQLSDHSIFMYTVNVGISLQPELDMQHSIITLILFQNPFHLGKLEIGLTKSPRIHVGNNGEHSWGENLYNGGEKGEHSSGEIFYGNITKKHIKSHHTWKLLQHPCSLDNNHNMDTSNVSSNHEKGIHKYRPSISEVDWGAHETIKMDTASLKLIRELMIQVFALWTNACSLKLIRELMIQVPTI